MSDKKYNQIHRREIYGVNFRVLLTSLVHSLVDWEQSLRSPPVHLGNELTPEWVNDTSYTRCCALAYYFSFSTPTPV